MTKEAKAALATIRQCLEDERFIVTTHFSQRMDQRGLMWPDVQAAFDDPAEVRDDGLDKLDRPKWVIAGDAADGLPIEVICVLDQDDAGDTTVFITLYWD